jgi:hypothetical protein
MSRNPLANKEEKGIFGNKAGQYWKSRDPEAEGNGLVERGANWKGNTGLL